MKNSVRLLIAAAAVVFVSAAGQARAGAYDSCRQDVSCRKGIAASPKVRAAFDERCKSLCAAQTQGSVSTTIPQALLAGSPKEQQLRSERAYANAVTTSSAGYETAGYRPTGSDGITASPKVRAQLDERRQSVEIAPLK
jgi:hypothetical protein